MSDKILHFIRHAEGEHNVGERYDLRDPILTPLGEHQCRSLSALTASTLQRTAELLVCSFMRRTLQTMVLGLPYLRKRLEAGAGAESKAKPPVILDILQEVNPYPCNRPTFPPEDILLHPDPRIREQLQGLVIGETEEGYADKTGLFSKDRQEERAEKVRRWLYERTEREIVVVGHVGILSLIAFGDPYGGKWDNCQDRVFTFASDDMSAPLKELSPADIAGRAGGLPCKFEPDGATEGPAAI